MHPKFTLVILAEEILGVYLIHTFVAKVAVSTKNMYESNGP